ncbi:MAG TPA: hypothetical protein PKC84_02735, partial [Paracoccaceae bacterium]|nr:hypothetical protein [Paracoccaceae bacterium]
GPYTVIYGPTHIGDRNWIAPHVMIGAPGESRGNDHPPLWDALRAGFAGQPLPQSGRVLTAMLATAFRSAAGQDWQGDDPIPVEALARSGGGLSNGLVAPRWWREVGLPLLLARWQAATSASR